MHATIDLLEQKRNTLQESQARFLAPPPAPPVNGDAWLHLVRQSAMDQFLRAGFPSTKDEEWRFTNVSPISKTEFHAAPSKTVSATTMQSLLIPDLTGPLVVFVNGRLDAALSSFQKLPAGLRILSLHDAMHSDRALIESHLKSHPVEKQDAFTNLNTAYLDGGVFIHVARGRAIQQPVHVLNISVTENSAFMTHPRNLIIADESSQVTVIEHYAAIGEGVYLTNAVTDIIVSHNANVHHYLLEEESSAAFNISTLRARQARDSHLTSHTVLLGGKLVRNNVHAILDGEHCDCLINGLYVSSNDQHMDNHMRVEHAKLHGDSRQFYKGILNDRSTAVFSGRIIVHPGAQKTDAKQTNKNLLLSDQTQVDTKPQLEIYADDVKCTHGATIGQLDEEAIFYLQARGIQKDSARSLLIHAFAGESLGRMEVEPIRNYLDRILVRRLPGGELLESVL